MGDTESYAGIVPDRWIEREGLRIFYASPGNVLRGLSVSLRTCNPSLIYLNSVFAPFTVFLLAQRRRGMISGQKILIAPRGEFNPGAMSLKTWKKNIYLSIARAAGLFRGVSFHATSSSELDEVRRMLGDQVSVRLAVNLGPRDSIIPRRDSSLKVPGSVKLVFCSRVVPKKNLHFLVETLKGLRGSVQLNIIGPKEDLEYTRKIEALQKSLPASVRVNWEGVVQPNRIGERLGANHFFVLPTLGENYGHAIVEAWAAGLPVLISDRTPWRGLDSLRCGWDLSLEDVGAWRSTLQGCIDMSETEYGPMHRAAFVQADRLHTAPPLEDWRSLFEWAALTG